MRLTEITTLRSEHVVLEPLTESHNDELSEATAEITEDLWFTSVPRPDQVVADTAFRLQQRDSGLMNPFVVRRATDGRVVGSTTLCNLLVDVPRAEIGYTWYTPAARGTAINPAAKLLLLQHAFEQCGVIAVEFRTHAHNLRSRAAIAKLGAKQDGILRNDRVGRDGTMRDTVVFSILPHEWPTVRLGLRARLARFDASPGTVTP